MMTQRSTKGKRLTTTGIFLGLILIIIGLFTINYFNYMYILVIVGFSLFVIGILVFNFRYNYFNCFTCSAYDVGEDEIQEVEDKGSKSKDSEYIYIKMKLTEEAVCMISKNRLDKNQEIIQCPNCSSSFLERYLLQWLDEKKTCPVCKFRLKRILNF